MDLSYYLNSKPITAFFCPRCHSWHDVPRNFTIATFLQNAEKKEISTFLKHKDEFFCFSNNTISNVYDKYTYSNESVDNAYSILIRNETIFFKGTVSRPTVPCPSYYAEIEGEISFQDISKNAIYVEQKGKRLEIIFHVYCHTTFTCSQCPYYGREYIYNCSAFEEMLKKNLSYYHEQHPRPHCTVLLGFAYELQESDPILPLADLKTRTINAQDQATLLEKTIKSLEHRIYIIKKYILKPDAEGNSDSKELDSFNAELKELLDKIAKYYHKLAVLYEISNSEYKEIDQYKCNVFSSLLDQGRLSFDRVYNTTSVKARDLHEQKAIKAIQSCDDIKAQLNNISRRINEITEMIHAIELKHPFDF